jgi:hypothetical protein
MAIFDNTKQTMKKQFTDTSPVQNFFFFEREIQKCYYKTKPNSPVTKKKEQSE